MKFLLLISLVLISFQIRVTAQVDTTLIKTILTVENLKPTDQTVIINKILSLNSEFSNQIVSEKREYNKYKKLYSFIHGTNLKKYTANPVFSEMFTKKEYNCVTASMIYLLIAEANQLPVEINETPVHVFLQFKDKNNEWVRIELTDPVDGFNSELDISSVINTMETYKLITKEEVKEKGERAIFTEFVEKSKPISKKELVGILYQNMGIKFMEKKNYKSAYSLFYHAFGSHPGLLLQEELLEESFEKYSWSLKEKTEWDSLKTWILNGIRGTEIPLSVKRKQLYFSELLLNQEIEHQNHYRESLSLIDTLEYWLPKEKAFTSTLNKWRTICETNIGIDYANTGNYEKAYFLFHNIDKREKNNAELRSNALTAGNNWVYSLIRQGKFELAVQAADSILNHHQDLPAAKEIYVNTILILVESKAEYRTNISKIEPFLKRALVIEPGFKPILRIYCRYYHENAMSQIRKGNYQAALKEVNKGLTYDNEDETLLSDKKDIQGLLKKK